MKKIQTSMSRSLVDPQDRVEFHTASKKLFDLMSKHIGRDQGISRRNLFKHFFGNPENMNQFQQLYYWGRILQITHYLRKETRCFVVTEQRKGDMFFFVAKDQKDADTYKKRADEQIKGYNKMKSRAQKAVDEKWYLQVAGGSGKTLKA